MKNCGLYKCMDPCGAHLICIRCVVVLLLFSATSVIHAQNTNVTVIFVDAPDKSTRNTTAAFRFVTRADNGSDPCGADCLIQCRLDEGVFEDCTNREAVYGNLTEGGHLLTLSVILSPGDFIPANYSWTVDRVPPTASLDGGPAYTNAVNVSVVIVFSEPCTGGGGFICTSSECDVYVDGPATVIPSTFQVIQAGSIYTLQVGISTQNVSGKLIVRMEDGFCTDAAGNLFERSSNSSFTIRFDRTIPTVNLWTAIQESQVQVDNQFMTIQATNNVEDLIIYMDFNESIATTNTQLLSSLQTTMGTLYSMRRKSKGNRRFGFLLANVTSNAIVTITLPGNSTYSRYGTPVPQAIVTFLYDSERSQVTISTTSLAKTKNHIILFLIQFAKPVFLFNSSSVLLSGGSLTRFYEVSKSTYTLEAYVADDMVISVSVAANVTSDVAGNLNLASNVARVRHYTVPSSSVALYSFTTASLIATAIASGALSISSATLAAAGVLNSRTSGSISADPSRNLLGMAAHLQVFALSDWLSVSLPVEYRESTRGLRWLIPHVNPPFQKQHSYMFVNNPLLGSSVETTTPIMRSFQPRSRGLLSNEQMSSSHINWNGLHHRGRMLGVNSTQYGPAFSASDYMLYLENKAGNAELRDMFLDNNYTGWRDFARNMFWLSVIVGGLIFLHMLLLLFLKLRTKTSVRGALTVPRFELFLLMLAIPCLCQAAAFIIRGGTTLGIIIGVLLLAIPAAFLFSVALFIAIAVLAGSLVQYKELVPRPSEDAEVSWKDKVVASLAGPNAVAKWVRKDGLAPTFLPRYGILFEDRKGPPKLVIFEGETGSFPKWVESGSNGIGRMRAVNSDDECEEAPVSVTQNFLGGGRTAYTLVDLSRRIVLGLIFGSYARSDRSSSQVSIALGCTFGQLLYLFSLKPFIRRGVQAVESVSLLCETGLFVTALVLLDTGHPSDDHLAGGIIMLAFLLVSFVCQLVNEWYALMKQLLRLSPSQEPSLKLGLKMLCRGIVLPFIPRGHWSKFIAPQLSHPRTGLVPVIPMSPDVEVERTRRSTSVQQGSPLIATGPEPAVPGYDPGSPCFIDPRNVVTQEGIISGEIKPDPLPRQDKPMWSSQWTRSRSLEGKRSRGSKSDPKSSELKMLRELAKASFPRWKKHDDPADPGLEISSPVPVNPVAGRRKQSASAPSRVGGGEDHGYTDDSLSDGSSDEDGIYQRPHLVGESSINEVPGAVMVAGTPPSSGSFEKGSKGSKGSGNLEQLTASLPLRDALTASRTPEER